MASVSIAPRLAARLCVLHLALSLAAGCTSGPQKREPREPRPSDEWADIPKTAEWLFVTRDFSGPRDEECKEVLDWVTSEEKCSTSLCVHARDLSREWLSRCTKLVPGEANGVKQLERSFTKRAEEDATDCGAEAEVMLREGCGKDKTCRQTAESWATRCGKSDGSPLVIRMLERAVERRLESPRRVTLDPRGCDELRAELDEASRCSQQFACEDAQKRVSVYRDRCEKDARPMLRTALLEMAVATGAQLPTPPLAIAAEGTRLKPTELPLLLADGSGIPLSLCEERVLTFDKYMAKRGSCDGGRLVLARAFREGSEWRVRVGSFEYPGDARFAQRLPSLMVAGEAEAREREARKSLDADLDRIAQLPAARAAEAAALLSRALGARGSLLTRSALLREALTSRDAALAGALRAIGSAKLALTKKTRLAPPDRVGFLTRARQSAFADVGAEGQVELGVENPLEQASTQELMPRAHQAYLDVLRPALEPLRRAPPRLDAKLSEMARGYAQEQAAACGAGEKTLNDAEQSLLNCGFGVEPCDEAKTRSLATSMEQARASAERARHQIYLAATGPAAAARDAIAQAAVLAGCLDPWW